MFSVNELGVIDTVDSPGLRRNPSSYECSEDWTYNLEKIIGEKAYVCPRRKYPQEIINFHKIH